MKAYSEDLRQRIVEAVDRGMSRVEVATLKRYLAQRRAPGQLSPKVRPGRPATKGTALAEQRDQLLTADPDATLDDLCRHWAALSGVTVSTATVRRAIRRHAWTRKKRRWVRVNATNNSGAPFGTESRSAPRPTL